ISNPGLEISVFFICLFKPDSPAISSRSKRSIKLLVVNISSALLIFLLNFHMSLSYQKEIIISIKKDKSIKSNSHPQYHNLYYLLYILLTFILFTIHLAFDIDYSILRIKKLLCTSGYASCIE